MATANQSARIAGSKKSSVEKKRPAWTKKGFPLTVAVFEFANGSNDSPPTFSVRLTRTFRRDESSEWENSEYLGGGDLLRAAKLLESADAFVQSRLEADYQSRRRDASDGNGDF